MKNLNSSRDGGFTLVELMIVVAVLAILATIAAPSFSELIASQRTRAAASALYDTLLLARSEAIKRNTNITIQSNSNDFAQGWRVLLADGTTDIRSQERFQGIGFLTSPTVTSVVFSPLGRTANTVDVTLSSSGTSKQWKVRVEASGRVCTTEGNGSC